MDKYAALEKDVYSVFSSVAWIAEAIKTIPDNYTTSGLGNEFVRVSIVPGGGNNTTFPWTASGQLIIDIFILAGEGTKRLSLIADKLDMYLAGKTMQTGQSGVTQFGQSSLVPIGQDKANPSLYRGSYSISFIYFGN